MSKNKETRKKNLKIKYADCTVFFVIVTGAFARFLKHPIHLVFAFIRYVIVQENEIFERYSFSVSASDSLSLSVCPILCLSLSLARS